MKDINQFIKESAEMLNGLCGRNVLIENIISTRSRWTSAELVDVYVKKVTDKTLECKDRDYNKDNIISIMSYDDKYTDEDKITGFLEGAGKDTVAIILDDGDYYIGTVTKTEDGHVFIKESTGPGTISVFISNIKAAYDGIEIIKKK